MSSPDKPVREQNLTIRVMRLSRPKFDESIPLSRDPGDVYSTSIADSVSNGDLLSIQEPIGTHILAPHTMSEVYLGESFTFYISIINLSAYTCKEISIKADIQTQTQRVSINEVIFDDVALAPNQQIGRIFTHEIQELGQHILVCALTYKTSSTGDERLNLRKFFKFPVCKPIELIKQNFYDIKSNEAFYQAEIQNLCINPIYIESIVLKDAKEQCNTTAEMISPSELNARLLGSHSIRQYVFRLGPDFLNRKTGYLSITWRTTMGDRGQMQQEIAPRIKPIGHDGLQVEISSAPKRVKANELFSIILRIQNYGTGSLDLKMCFDQSRQSKIIYCSINGQCLPTIRSNQFIEISLDFLPYLHGLQHITGLKLIDVQRKRVYEFNDLAQIFVY